MTYADLDADSQVELLRPVAAEGARQLGLEAADLALVSHAYNTTFRLTTPQGEVVAVRVLTNSDSTTAQLAAQHAWMHALARDTAIAVPDPVLGPDGQDHAVVASAEVGRDVVVVAASWLPGDDVGTDLSEEQAHTLGATMARMHEHAERWHPPEGASLPVYDDPLFGAEDVLSSSPLPDGGAELVLGALADARAAYAAIGEADLIPIHADLHGGNLKWHEGRLAVFDFDDSGLGTPVLDLAISAFYLRGWSASGDAAEAAMRAGYASVRPLPDVDEATFETLVAGRQLLLGNDLLTTSTASLRAEAAAYAAVTCDRLRAWRETGRFTRAVGETRTLG